jgi:hypothetical protein
MAQAGKILILLGAVAVLIGVIIYFFGDKFTWLGHLPGDIRIEKENFRFYFPITTMILLSIILNILYRIYRYFF